MCVRVCVRARARVNEFCAITLTPFLLVPHVLQARNDPLIEPVITPRFVPTCTLDLMTQLGALARQESVLVQSHLSETESEIAWVKELHPMVGMYSLLLTQSRV